MKNEITVTISGKQNTGKSRLAYLIKEMLRVYELETEFDPGIDYLNEQAFDRTVRATLDEALVAIRDKTRVVVKEECV